MFPTFSPCLGKNGYVFYPDKKYASLITRARDPHKLSEINIGFKNIKDRGKIGRDAFIYKKINKNQPLIGEVYVMMAR